MLSNLIGNIIGRELADAVARHRTLAFGRHLIRKERLKAKWRPLRWVAVPTSQDSSKGATA